MVQNSFAQDDDYYDWTESATIDINTSGIGTNGNELNDFPLLIRFNGGNQPSADFWNEADANGIDIRFALTSNTSVHFRYGIEEWNTVNEEAYIGVK